MANYGSENLIDEKKRLSKELQNTFSLIFAIIILLCCFLYYKNFVYTVIQVSGDSMQPTLESGDVLIADRTASVKFGDIVVVYSNQRKHYIIKRVVGLPGDVLWTENGYLFREYTDNEGKRVFSKVNEDYVCTVGITTFNGKIKVSEGCLFVLGDNRRVSSDSRAFGEVSSDLLLGVVTDWSLKYKDTAIISWYKKFLNG